MPLCANNGMPDWYHWDPKTHFLEFFGIKSVLFWQVPSLSTILRPAIEELGEAYYYLLVAFEASKGTTDDYHSMVTRLADSFPEGLQRWGDAVATAGWGQLHVHRIDPGACIGELSVTDPWELNIYRADDVGNNLPFLSGKLSGIFSQAFGRNMRARVMEVREQGGLPEALITVTPCTATLESELDELLRRTGFSRYERLQFINRQLRERTDELALVNELLAASRDQCERNRRTAEDANAAKTQLLTAMSHELRTPLNAILGFSEMIRDQALGPDAADRYRGYADDIHRSGQLLLDLINDLLDLAKIESGKVGMNIEAIDVPDAVRSCLRLMRPKAAAKGLIFDMEPVAGDCPRLLGDPRAVRQMVLNLISNAIKFTPSGGRVMVRIRHGDTDGLVIAVSDTGSGLTEDDLRGLFRPFARGSYAIARGIEGTGLGLALVKSMMDRHGGRVSVDSRPGQGSTFGLHFPPTAVDRRVTASCCC